MRSPTHDGMGRWRWLHWPLNRLFVGITWAVLLFLAVIGALGLRQYLLYNQCSQAVAAGDRLLFRFTAIKDHLNESLMRGDEINLHTVGDTLQHLDRDVTELTGNILVPEGMKAHLPSRVVLVGLEVRLRAIQELRQERVREAAELVHTLNDVNVGLQQFRIMLSDHTQFILLGLHKIIAGALGLVVVLSCTLLYLINRSLAGPMLALCRLTAPHQEEGGEGDAMCSLHTLVGRVREVLTRATGSPGEGMTAAVRPADLALHQSIPLHRAAAAGCLSAELASELTNRINGVINYIQALIDLNDQGGNRETTAAIFPSLVVEARKTAALIGALQRIGQWHSGRDAGLSLRALLDLLNLVFQKSLAAESITLVLPHDGDAETSVAAGDLWLVLCTMVQWGRRVLKHSSTDQQVQKRLTLERRIEPGHQDRLTLLFANSTGFWMDDHPEPGWPTLAFCTQLLQQQGASLLLDDSTGISFLVLHLPLRQKAS